jgi:cytochrome c2
MADRKLPFGPAHAKTHLRGRDNNDESVYCIGRRSGTVPGFRYSRAMKSAAITWDEGSLDRYLSNPQAFVPGNIMPLSGVSDGPQRAAIIAYLKTLR